MLTTLYQVMTFDQAEKFEFNPFDLTKVWSQADYPLIPVGEIRMMVMMKGYMMIMMSLIGKITLNRNPRNYFAEVEQLAFSPAHLVPGIEPR